MKNKVTENNLSQIFYDRAGELANKLTNQILTLGTAIIASFFYIAINNVEVLTSFSRISLIVTVLFFGLSVFFTIVAIQYDADRNYFLAEMNNPKRKSDYEINTTKKEHYDKLKRKYSGLSKILFIIGTFSAIFTMVVILYA